MRTLKVVDVAAQVMLGSISIAFIDVDYDIMHQLAALFFIGASH